MNAEEVGALPRLPESVGDWEELLVRLEIVPRVVRGSVEEVGDSAGAARVLAAAATRERAIGRWLEVAARLDDGASGPPERFAGDERPEALALRFASLRARTFAMVQRRGLEVWEWEAPLEGGNPVTAHQLLSWLARRDGQLLFELRRAVATRRVEC